MDASKNTLIKKCQNCDKTPNTVVQVNIMKLIKSVKRLCKCAMFGIIPDARKKNAKPEVWVI